MLPHRMWGGAAAVGSAESGTSGSAMVHQAGCACQLDRLQQFVALPGSRRQHSCGPKGAELRLQKCEVAAAQECDRADEAAVAEVGSLAAAASAFRVAAHAAATAANERLAGGVEELALDGEVAPSALRSCTPRHPVRADMASVGGPKHRLSEPG